MKFIRDIIGEKRQLQPEINGAEFTQAPDAMLGYEHPAEEETPLPELDAAAPAEHELSIDDAPATIGLEDEIASFFAAHGARDQVEPLSAASEETPETQETPERVAEITPEIRTETALPDFDTPAPTTARDTEIAEEVERALVSEHRPDPDLEAVFKAARDMGHKAGEWETQEEDVAQASHPAQTPHAAPPKATESMRLSPEWRMAETLPETGMHAPSIPPSEAAPVQPISVPQPAMGRGVAQHGRVKTRLLGFNSTADSGLDPLTQQEEAQTAPYTSFPVGWLIVVSGAGRGSAFTLFNGVSTIGRGEDQIIRLDFGDNAISRENHASVAYDPVQKGFFIGHGGKANLVRRNDRPVLSTEELRAGDQITIGETVLRFVPLCGPDFSWDAMAKEG